MSTTNQPTVGTLLDQLVSDQLSENEATDLFTLALTEYQNAKTGQASTPSVTDNTGTTGQ